MSAMSISSGVAGGDLGSADPRRWVRLAAQLRGQISDGTLAVGSPVPSINVLTEELGWGRQTCGRAMQQLEREGLLVRVPGLGYFVVGP
jgi:DNA-binding GntR family transcriptional regulator